MEPVPLDVPVTAFELFIRHTPFGSELGPWELLVTIILAFGALAVVAIAAKWLLVRELPW